MRKMMVTALIGVAAMATSPAQAGVVVTSMPFGLDTTPAGSTVITFDSALPAGFSLSGGSVRNYSDAAGAEPAWTTDTQETSYYLAANANDPATISSVVGYKSVSFLWGSIDDYNTLTLLDRNGATIQSFTGIDVGPPANGDQGAASTNRRVTFTVDGDTSAIYGLRFQSGQPAFEVDNVAFSGAVPEPATWAMMIGGFAGVGFMLRRRQAQMGSTAATC